MLSDCYSDLVPETGERLCCYDDVEDAAPRRLTAGARRSPPRRKTRARRPAEVTVEHEDRVVAVAAGAGHSIVLSAAGVASCCGRGQAAGGAARTDGAERDGR